MTTAEHETIEADVVQESISPEQMAELFAIAKQSGGHKSKESLQSVLNEWGFTLDAIALNQFKAACKIAAMPISES